MFRLPSIQTLAEQFQATVSRFLWVVFIALAKSIFLIYFIETSFKLTDQRDWILRLIYITSLGLPLALTIALVAERRRWPAGREFAAFGLLLAVLAGYYFSMGDETNFHWHFPAHSRLWLYRKSLHHRHTSDLDGRDYGVFFVK